MSLPALNTTNSKGQIGLGAVIAIGPAASVTGTPAYVTIGEVTSIKPGGQKRNVVKYNLTDRLNTQKRAGVQDAGTTALEIARVADDAGQIALAAAANDPTGQPYLFRITLYPNTSDAQATTGDVIGCVAIVSEYNPLTGITAEGLISMAVTLEQETPWAVTTAGA
jgi:hypothetical protein